MPRLADIPVADPRLESLHVGGTSGNDGTIEVVTLQQVRSHNLPAMVTQLHRGDLLFRREERWGPVTDDIATASVQGDRGYPSIQGATPHHRMDHQQRVIRHQA